MRPGLLSGSGPVNSVVDASANIDSLPVLLKTIKTLFYIFINLTVRSAYEFPIKRIAAQSLQAGALRPPAAVQPRRASTAKQSASPTVLGPSGIWGAVRGLETELGSRTGGASSV